MTATERLQQEYFSEEEILSILKIKRSTLSARRSTGTEHPPYIEIGRTRLYPVKMFLEWAEKRPITWEVRRAS